MAIQALLDRIRASERMLEILSWPFDIDVMAQLDADWFQLWPDIHRHAIAQDATGGIYLLCGAEDSESQAVFFVSSEGQAGQVAPTLREALQIIVTLPFWRDCLKFSGGGNFDEMQRAMPYLEREMQEDEPDIDVLREELLTGLSLERPDNALRALYESIMSPVYDLKVISRDGIAFGSLFNHFVVEDNPLWK